jgi:serine protease Do
MINNHKKIKKICLAASILLVSAAGFTAPDDINASFINAAQAVKNSVVSITIYERKNTNLNKVAFGSGTIISDGYIVTNYHVVMKGDYYQVLFNDVHLDLKKFSNGSFYLADPKTDIALLKFNNQDELPLKPAEFDNSDKLNEGEWVLAIGNPFGLNRTITSGIVSSTGRDNIGFTDIEDFIQSDVPINPGNSGGPLINLRGKVVGINTAIRSESGGFQGISFSIPSNLVKQVCDELIEHGRVRRGWIGFLVKEKRKTPGHNTHYLQILSVLKNSPAESAGVRVGDIVREIDGEKITTLGSLIRTVGNKRIGSRIEISLAREGRIENVLLVLRERKIYANIRKGLNILFNRYGIEIDENSETGAVVISYISPKSMSLNLKKGDIILSINEKKISSLDSFIRIFDKYEGRINTIRVNRDSKVMNINLMED